MLTRIQEWRLNKNEQNKIMTEKEVEFEEEYVFEFEEEQSPPMKACVEFIESYKKGHNPEDTPYVTGPDEVPYEITDERIFPIPLCKENRKLGFVDGGHAPVIKSSDFCICFHRVAGALFEGYNYIQITKIPEVIEYYTATILNPKEDGSLEYITKFFPRESEYRTCLPGSDIIIRVKEAISLSGSKFIPKIEKFGGIARRFAEWSYARELVAKELGERDIFVKDGSLQTGFKGEIILANQLYKIALSKKVYVTGLSKSCRLITNKGDSLISIVDFLAEKKFPKSKWYFHPIYKITKADNQADLYFVKLHEHSAYPFRFDIYVEQSEKLDKDEREMIVSNLASNSADLSFPGYPYGLIKVDQLSRVAYRELETHKIMLLSEFDKDNYENFILPRLRSIDAHDLLNKIRKN